jgi:hypothetical protein
MRIMRIIRLLYQLPNNFIELLLVKRDLLQCQKRPITVSKETHYSVKRDPLQCQKRPITVSKETHYSATQQLHRIIMEQKNEINDLKTRLARLEAIIDSSLIVDGTTSNGTCMSYEEEDTCLSLIVDGTTSNGTDA